MNIAELELYSAGSERRFSTAFYSNHRPTTQNASNIEQAFKAPCNELNAQGSINIVLIIHAILNRRSLKKAPVLNLAIDRTQEVNLTDFQDKGFGLFIPKVMTRAAPYRRAGMRIIWTKFWKILHFAG